MSRVNFHTHTSRCKHAYGKDEEYVISAIENQYKIYQENEIYIKAVEKISKKNIEL